MHVVTYQGPGVAENGDLSLLTQATSGEAQPLHPQLRLKQHFLRLATVTGTGEKFFRVRLWG